MTNEAKFTPGPWAVTSSTGEVHSQARNGQNWICQGPNDSPAAPPAFEIEANARLIACAPDMFDALKAISNAYCSNGNTRRQKAAFAQVRATLAKATGAAP